MPAKLVPAKAGSGHPGSQKTRWIPACARMTTRIGQFEISRLLSGSLPLPHHTRFGGKMAGSVATKIFQVVRSHMGYLGEKLFSKAHLSFSRLSYVANVYGKGLSRLGEPVCM